MQPRPLRTALFLAGIIPDSNDPNHLGTARAMRGARGNASSLGNASAMGGSRKYLVACADALPLRVTVCIAHGLPRCVLGNASAMGGSRKYLLPVRMHCPYRSLCVSPTACRAMFWAMHPQWMARVYPGCRCGCMAPTGSLCASPTINGAVFWAIHPQWVASLYTWLPVRMHCPYPQISGLSASRAQFAGFRRIYRRMASSSTALRIIRS